MLTKADIEERFMRAAEVDRLRSVVGSMGPAQPGSSMPHYVHDFADKNGWGTERLREERAEFFAALDSRCTPRDITDMEECLAWTTVVTRAEDRRALWAWAISKGRKAKSFKAWCREEGIHPNTGKLRKNAAVKEIVAHLARCEPQRENDVPHSMLPDPQVQAYLGPTFESAAPERKRPSWKDDPSLAPVFDESMRENAWARDQNERRRRKRAEREAKDQAA